MNDQLKTAFEPIGNLFAKHHSVIFAAVVILMLAIAVYALYDVTSQATAPVSDSGSTISDFDKKTIDKIKNLHDSSNVTDSLVFPSPRANPFSE